MKGGLVAQSLLYLWKAEGELCLGTHVSVKFMESHASFSFGLHLSWLFYCFRKYYSRIIYRTHSFRLDMNQKQWSHIFICLYIRIMFTVQPYHNESGQAKFTIRFSQWTVCCVSSCPMRRIRRRGLSWPVMLRPLTAVLQLTMQVCNFYRAHEIGFILSQTVCFLLIYFWISEIR